MRMPCGNSTSEQGQEAANRFFPGLVFLLGCSRVSQGLPGPLPVRATLLKGEGTTVMGIREDILYPYRQVRDYVGCAPMPPRMACWRRARSSADNPCTTSPYRGASH